MTNRYINSNGEILDSETPVATAGNRSLRYGDGLFETMRWEKNRLTLGDFHFERLFRGMGILNIELTAGFTAAYLTNQIRNLCEKNGMESARVRLNVHRQDNPGLVPVNNRPCFIIETAELSGNHTDPLRATVYTAEKKSMGVLSNLKVNNYLLYILAGRHAALNGADEAIVLNSAGRICEATSSNLFFISGKKILTPALSEGCVAGVMRRQLIGCLPELGFVVEEAGIPVEIPEQVEEVFLSNAIRGIRPLASIGDRKFSHHQTLEILRRLPDPAAG